MLVADDDRGQIHALYAAYHQIRRCPTRGVGHKRLYARRFERVYLPINIFFASGYGFGGAQFYGQRLKIGNGFLVPGFCPLNLLFGNSLFHFL